MGDRTHKLGKTTSRLRRVAIIANAQVAPRRRMLVGVARYIREHDPWAIYLKPFGVDSSLNEWAQGWDGDGIISAVWNADPAAMKRIRIPIVDMVGCLHNQQIPLVHANDRSIGHTGAEHLIARGFRSFGFIEHPVAWSRDRRIGFEEAVGKIGSKVPTLMVLHPADGRPGPSFWEEQQSSLVQWIQSLPKPVGVMASTDLTGQQFLEACQRAHVVVPEQVAVVGADNDELICDICCPPLSSVVINDAQRGYEAAALLDRMMNGHAPPRNAVYIEPTGIKERASTDILAIDDESLVRALRFVRDHACESIGVEDVVRAVPVSRAVLERRFRKIVGRTILDEIVRVRLNRAVELLCETELELKLVAHKAGFGTPSYMGAVFRERLGRTPGSYRSTAKGSRERTP